MSNATVSSQVYVIRNAGALAAVDAGTMILYADGSDVFAKDASGNVYNLTSASAVSLAFNDLTDVSIAGATSTQILQYNGTNWTAVDVFDLGELGDVSVSGATTGQVLQYNGTSWVAATPSSGGASTLNGLTDVDTTGVADGDVIVYNSGTWEVGQAMQTFSITDGNNSFAVSNSDTTRFTAGTGLHSISTPSTKQIQYSLSANASDLGDVTYTSPSAGQVLQWSGAAWTNSGISIDELSDVDTTTVAPTDGQALVWDNANSQWEPGTISGGSGIALTDLSVTSAAASGDGSLSYDNTTGVFTHTPADVPAALTDLGITDGTNGQVLTTDGSGSFTFENASGGIALTDLSVGSELSATGNGAISYSNTTGVFRYAPPTAAGIGALEDITGEPLSDLSDVVISSAASGQVLEYNGTNWVNATPSAGASYSAEPFALTRHQMVIVKKEIPQGSEINHNVNVHTEGYWHTVTGDSNINSTGDTITLRAQLTFPVRPTMDTDGTNSGVIKFEASGPILTDIPISIQGHLIDPKAGGAQHDGAVTVSGDMVFANGENASTIGEFTMTTAQISDICAKQIMLDNSLTDLGGLVYQLSIVFGGTPTTNVSNTSFNVVELTIPMEM